MHHRPHHLALCLLLCTLGCRSTLPPKPLAQLTPQESHGHDVFLTRCRNCHYDRRDEDLHGPALIGIFQKPYLHSGAPANDERVTSTVLHGHNLMPAQPDIDPDDLRHLLAYLHTL